jgi:hypothetical protein
VRPSNCLELSAAGRNSGPGPHGHPPRLASRTAQVLRGRGGAARPGAAFYNRGGSAGAGAGAGTGTGSSSASALARSAHVALERGLRHAAAVTAGPDRDALLAAINDEESETIEGSLGTAIAGGGSASTVAAARPGAEAAAATAGASRKPPSPKGGGLWQPLDDVDAGIAPAADRDPEVEASLAQLRAADSCALYRVLEVGHHVACRWLEDGEYYPCKILQVCPPPPPPPSPHTLPSPPHMHAAVAPRSTLNVFHVCGVCVVLSPRVFPRLIVVSSHHPTPPLPPPSVCRLCTVAFQLRGTKCSTRALTQWIPRCVCVRVLKRSFVAGRRSCVAHSIKHLPRSLLCFCRFGGCIQVPVARLRLLSDDEKAELVATVRASEAAASAGRKKRKGGAAGYVSALPSHAQCRRDVSRCTSRGK